MEKRLLLDTKFASSVECLSVRFSYSFSRRKYDMFQFTFIWCWKLGPPCWMQNFHPFPDVNMTFSNDVENWALSPQRYSGYAFMMLSVNFTMQMLQKMFSLRFYMKNVYRLPRGPQQPFSCFFETQHFTFLTCLLIYEEGLISFSANKCFISQQVSF